MDSQQDEFYRALLTRDYRFDGKFFVGVKTTYIYCRPICPAKPKKKNIEFFPDALAAEKAGYRPCLRCRPESAPQSPAWMGRSALVQRALKLITKQLLSGLNEEKFSNLLGVSPRHLRRLFEQEVGKTPRQIWDNNRLDFARKLIVETSMSFTEIAFNSGFSSIRRFNDSVKKRFQRSPSDLRNTSKIYHSDIGIELSLSYRPPFDWDSLIQFYKSHEITGIECIGAQSYERVFSIDNSVGAIRVERANSGHELKLKVVTDNHKNLYLIVQKVRKMFDLDSDPVVISNHFSQTKLLSELFIKYPGLRIPRAWDPFETAICTILGQLVSMKQAKSLVSQLIQNYGTQVKNPLVAETQYLFPSAKVLASASLDELGTTGARKNTIREFASQVLKNEVSLETTQPTLTFRESLLKIKGIGLWTAEYISLRALGDPDAFPHTDLILKRVIDNHPEINLDQMKPWRAYAAIYLWKEFALSLSRISKKETKKKSSKKLNKAHM